MLPEANILSYFNDLEDPRTGDNIAHPLENVIAILAVICSADGWVDVERYGKAKHKWLHCAQPGESATHRTQFTQAT